MRKKYLNHKQKIILIDFYFNGTFPTSNIMINKITYFDVYIYKLYPRLAKYLKIVPTKLSVHADNVIVQLYSLVQLSCLLGVDNGFRYITIIKVYLKCN